MYFQVSARLASRLVKFVTKFQQIGYLLNFLHKHSNMYKIPRIFRPIGKIENIIKMVWRNSYFYI